MHPNGHTKIVRRSTRRDTRRLICQSQSLQVKNQELDNLDVKLPQLFMSKSSLGPSANWVTCMSLAMVLASEHIFRPEVNLMRIAHDVLEQAQPSELAFLLDDLPTMMSRQKAVGTY